MSIEFKLLSDETAKDVAMSVAPRLRAKDAAECAALGLSAYEAVRLSVRASTLAYGAFEDGECVAVWGITAPIMLGTTAQPWLLTTNVVEQNKKLFLKANRTFVDFVKGHYPLLETWVHAEYKEAIRWLHWLGFTVEPPSPFGPLKELFCRVTIGEAS